MDLLEDTIERLQRRELTPLSKATGFSYQWLWQIKNRKTKNPGVEKIEQLHQYLLDTSNDIPS